MIDACKVELCETTTVEQKEEAKAFMLEEFVNQCTAVLPENDPIVCDWPSLSGNAASGQCSGQNMVFDPCGKKCEMKECNKPLPICTSD